MSPRNYMVQLICAMAPKALRPSLGAGETATARLQPDQLLANVIPLAAARWGAAGADTGASRS